MVELLLHNGYTDHITILDVAAVDSTDKSSSYCEAIGVYQDCML